MLLKDKLSELGRDGKALLATNFYNFETLSGVLQAAALKNRSVILQLSESSIHYLGMDVAVAMARPALKQYGVKGWLHLDHGSSVEMVQRCLDAGFDSVMIDASEKPFDENVKITSQVVRIAEKYQANVEAELGYVAKLGQLQEVDQFTQPEQAARFVQETGVDALAVAIGSAHGFYKATPRLQLDLLEKIHQATPAALVLHGSSGLPNDQLRDAIQRGIVKVNLATEIKNIFMRKLQEVLSDNEEIDLRKVFPRATESVTSLIAEKLDIVSP
ncbi:MAG: class II fructose-bisphosphate aldolase [Bacteroidota bacterium]|nr:class II fructose-bisphosphate aldolase [Bacteroidota bacterium]